MTVQYGVPSLANRPRRSHVVDPAKGESVRRNFFGRTERWPISYCGVALDPATVWTEPDAYLPLCQVCAKGLAIDEGVIF